MKKEGYFQGTEEPKPKKKQYKSDKAIVIQPRFKEPFYRNFDLYKDPKFPNIGPGTRQERLKKHKSKVNDKYKADDLWIEDNGTLTKKQSNRIQRILELVKFAIDFPTDDQIKSDPILPEEDSYSNSVYLGGLGDFANPRTDFEDKSPNQLDFGRDYEISDLKLDKLLKKYLNPAEPEFLGMPDGVDNREKDVDQTINKSNPFFGTTDLGNTLYSDPGNKLI